MAAGTRVCLRGSPASTRAPPGGSRNCQVGVSAAYVTPDESRALIDWEPYLPEKWTSDQDRCVDSGSSRPGHLPCLFTQHIQATHTAGFHGCWSHWRRHRQATARKPITPEDYTITERCCSTSCLRGYSRFSVTLYGVMVSPS
jgi:hypothetical protein